MDISKVLYGITLGTYVDGICREFYLGKMAEDLITGILDAGPSIPSSLRTLAKSYKALMSQGRIAVPPAFKTEFDQETLADLIDTDLLLLAEMPANYWRDLYLDDEDEDEDEDEDLDADEDEDETEDEEDDEAADMEYCDIQPHTIHIDDLSAPIVEALVKHYHIVCDDDGYLVCLLPHGSK